MEQQRTERTPEQRLDYFVGFMIDDFKELLETLIERDMGEMELPSGNTVSDRHDYWKHFFETMQELRDTVKNERRDNDNDCQQ